jgi:hypothetical protein
MKRNGAISAVVHILFVTFGSAAQAQTAPTKTADAPAQAGPSPSAGSPAPGEPLPAAPAPALAVAPAVAAVAPSPGAPAAPVALPPSPAAPPPAALAPPPGQAVVHLAVNYRDAWLETRSYVDDGDFTRTCRAPCDIKLDVVGLEARVVAPGMTPSNAFRFDAGTGRAGVRVDGGSAAARTWGVVTLAAGIPVALAGMALFALGKQQDQGGTKAAGIAGLALGGVSIGVSLPLLLIGTTRVKSASGSRIASLFPVPPQH